MKITLLRNLERFDVESLESNIKKFNERKYTYGELGNISNINVNLQNVTHQISNLRIEGDVLVGDIEILPTQSGNILLNKKESEFVVHPRILVGGSNITSIITFDIE